MKPAFAAIFVLIACVAASAQVKQAPADSVRWAFPRPGLVSVDVEGDTFYQLSPECFGNKVDDNGLTGAIILFTPKMVALAQLANIQDPNKLPDVDQFLAAVAVSMAVDTPKGYTNEYLGKGKPGDRLLYVYRTKTGATVIATISTDRRKVYVVPAPSEY